MPCTWAHFTSCINGRVLCGAAGSWCLRGTDVCIGALAVTPCLHEVHSVFSELGTTWPLIKRLYWSTNTFLITGGLKQRCRSYLALPPSTDAAPRTPPLPLRTISLNWQRHAHCAPGCAGGGAAAAAAAGATAGDAAVSAADPASAAALAGAAWAVAAVAGGWEALVVSPLGCCGPVEACAWM